MPISWEPVNVEPVKTPDGRVTVPEEVITSMERNKLGLKGEPAQKYIKYKINNIVRHCLVLLHTHVCVGPLETQIGKGAVSLNLTLRRQVIVLNF